MLGITAIITTFNEEQHITDALRSVSWCDEIIVVDSFSSDNTVDLIKREQAILLQHPYESPAKQKNWAIPQASHDRILLLDADERCTPELRTEIENLMAGADLKDAYWIKRINHFMGQRVRFSGWQDDKVIRFFHRDHCRYTESLVHEEIETEGSIGYMKQKLVHYTFSSMDQYMMKFDRYTTNSAKDRVAKTSRVSWYHLQLKPAFRFFRHFILRFGFLDGRVGFVISKMSALSVAERYRKIARLKAGEQL